MRPRSDEPTRAFRAVAVLSRPLVHHAFRLRVSGVEHLPAGGFVLGANHLSALDPWALAAPLYPRQPRFMAKAELFRRPFRTMLAAAGLFPVRRGQCCPSAIVTAIRHARAGRIVVVFPEGVRRKKARGSDVGPRPGAARIALAAGVPLVPAAVGGTERLSDAPWRVAFGPPVDLAGLHSLAPRDAARHATTRLWAAVGSLEEHVA